MTTQDAIAEVRKVGTIRAEAGRLKVRFPATLAERLRPALNVLKQDRDAALAVVGSSLKGTAVELCHRDGRFWIVADEADAAEAMARFGLQRGEIWTGAEIERVAGIRDEAVRLEVMAWKRMFAGTIARLEE